MRSVIFRRPVFLVLVLVALVVVFHNQSFFSPSTSSTVARGDNGDADDDNGGTADPTGKIRGVIYLMLGHDSQTETCQKVLQQMGDHLPVKYPVIIFYDDVTLIELLEVMKNKVKDKVDVRLVKLDFEIPEWVPANKVSECPAGFTGKIGSIGYRHMCRFYSGEVFRHPVLQEFDYAWRLDPDSALDCPIKEDPFEVMRRNGYKYGFSIYFFDNNLPTGETLWKAVNDYVKENDIVPKSGFEGLSAKFPSPFPGTYHRCHYWNNSELMYLRFFRSKKYLDFFDYLDRAGGFYQHRWGDALVRTMGVNLMLEESEIHLFSDIAYAHGGFRNTANCPNYNPDDTACPNGHCKHCTYLERTFRGVGTDHIYFAIGVVIGVFFVIFVLAACCYAIGWCRRDTKSKKKIQE